MTTQRETVRCNHCDLNQYKPSTGMCRRCGKHLLAGSIETILPIYLRAPAEPAPVIPMRAVMQAAAVHAVQYIGHTTKAAERLGIPHGRLKQLLREAGGDYGRDRRFDGKRGKP